MKSGIRAKMVCLIILGTLLFTACKPREKSPTDTPILSSPTDVLSNATKPVDTPTTSPTIPYPAPEQEVTNQAYPVPGTSVQELPYPAPDLNAAAIPYPAPRDQASANQTQPGLNAAADPYPAPGDQASAGQPQTGQSSGQVNPSPDSSSTPTPSPDALVPTPTFLPTPLPARSELRATDPATVQLSSGKPQFIMFFAFWCGTCKAMAPVVHQLETQYSDRINFVYLDTDDPETAQLKHALGYKHQPHYLLVDGDGKILNQWLDRVDAEDFESAFAEVKQ